MEEFRPGDIVQIKDPSNFVSAFSKKIKERDAIVDWVGPDELGQFKNKMKVTFKKRNGRGKEFSEIMRVSDFKMIEKKS